MNIEEILKSLECYTEEYPRAALEQAIAQRESITPHLLEVLRYVRVTPIDQLPQGYWLHTWATYLLAQFRETRAYPLFVELLELPGDHRELHGEDMISDVGANILASVCGGDPSLIQRLAENPELEEFVRGAAIQAMVILVASDQRSREETLEYFRHLFHTGQAEEGSFFWSQLVHAAAELYPDTLLMEIREAYERDLPDPFYIPFEQVVEVLEGGFAAAQKELLADRSNRLIKDVFEESEWWQCFQPKREYTPPPSPAPRSPLSAPPVRPIRNDLLPDPPIWFGERPQPVMVERRPGRNDKCHCGSGRKYKVCCLKEDSA